MRTHPSATGIRLVSAALVAIALIAGGCGLRGDPEQPEVAPTVVPEPEPEPEPEPPPAAEPVAVEITDIAYEALSNVVLIGREPEPPDDAVLAAAVEGARQALERYLNVQFVDPATRFGATGVQGLLTAQAMAIYTAAPQPGLAEMEMPLAALQTAPVRATATVLMDGAEVLSVLLRYDAEFHVDLSDGLSGPLTQRGALLFVAAEDGWRADVVDLALDVPGEPAA